APVAYPRFSPDGEHIAYTSRTSGGPEVWVTAAEGDTAPRRLTAWGRPATKVVGWLPDGRIVASTSYGAPIARDAQLWAIDLEGETELLPLGRSGEVAIHSSGTTVVSTPWRRDQASWKHYQGGTAVKLWISRQDVPLDAPTAAHADRAWEPLLDELLASKLRIAWYGDRLLFASDTPGPGAARTDRASANLWSIALDVSDLRAHTPLRAAKLASAWQCGGLLCAADTPGPGAALTDRASAKRWSIARAGSDLRAHTSFSAAQGYLREPATDGSTIVFSSRGRLFAMDSL